MGRPKTMTELLKDAIVESGQSHLSIERETGVLRACIMRFLRDEQSLRLDNADKLAAHFGIVSKRTSKSRKGDK